MNAEMLLRVGGVIQLVGGVIQLSILTASALVPGKLQWRADLKQLPPLSRQLIWVHGGYVVLMIAAMGLISLCEAALLADRSVLARTLCGFIAVFWGLRLAIQVFVFDGKSYLVNRLLKVGYHGLTVAFICLTAIYGYAALGL